MAAEGVAVAQQGEIGERLKKAAARVGALTVSLIWDITDDLDLHAESPMATGERGQIFCKFTQRQVACDFMGLV